MSKKFPVAGSAETMEGAIALGRKLLNKHKPPQRTLYRAGSILGKVDATVSLITPRLLLHGSDLKVRKRYIEWTSEEGELRDDTCYRAIMVPAKGDEKFCFGFVQMNLGSILSEAEKKGYFKVSTGPNYLRKTNVSKIVRAMIPLREKYPNEDWLSLVLSITEQWLDGLPFRFPIKEWAPEFAAKCFFGPDFQGATPPKNEEWLLNKLKELQGYCRFHGLKPLSSTPPQVGIYVVPKWYYRGCKKMAQKGWFPLTPLWLGKGMRQYNHGYDGGCRGSFPGFDCAPRPSSIEERAMQGEIVTYTLHVPYNPCNYIELDPDPAWKKKVQEVMSSFDIPAKEYSHSQQESFLLAAGRDVPFIVSRPEGLSYYRLELLEMNPYMRAKIRIVRTKPDGQEMWPLTGKDPKELIKEYTGGLEGEVDLTKHKKAQIAYQTIWGYNDGLIKFALDQMKGNLEQMEGKEPANV